MDPRSTRAPTGPRSPDAEIGGLDAGTGTAGPDRTNPKVRQVLDAARILFLEQPYDSVSTDAIARQAGISKATLYVHFPSKEMLFATLVTDQCRGIEGDIWSADRSGDGVETVLRAIARNFMAMLAGPEAIALYRTIVAQVPRFPELGHAFHEAGPKQLQGRIAAFLAGASDRGEIDVPDPALAAVQFLQLVAADIPMRGLLGLKAPTPDQIDETIESGIRLFMRAHRPRATD